ncbi:OLC1v1021444C1 [Oldenlandia corymbosa var. corymbosa]|uniref:OLC1v1021444C1 n=1 Tax=Oldenlandia corymbosa var. corymbosa TaxID=529605 RepID=A0AAV1BXY4_OLDCO|nr:OLC1v1021444C1 [Oldenlandia corymbosa var. corymbosa]
MGYWPNYLYTYLADSASIIEWGGEIINSQPDVDMSKSGISLLSSVLVDGRVRGLVGDNPGEFSLAQIWVVAGPADDLETVEAECTIIRRRSGKTLVKMISNLHNDAYQKQECYNLLCPGFVQTSSQATLGGTIVTISTYHDTQIKDSGTQVWWLSVQTNTTIGYWPDSLFTDLADSASAIEWGGEIINTKPNGQHTTTQMRSGHFGAEGFGGASYFKNLQVKIRSRQPLKPRLPTTLLCREMMNLDTTSSLVDREEILIVHKKKIVPISDQLDTF